MTGQCWPAGSWSRTGGAGGAGARDHRETRFRRILHSNGLITPEPKKRPKASLHRFEAHQPNETWQSDFTHWALADGTDTEILNFLDDHSRYLLACTAYRPVTVTAVVATFLACAAEYGLPASTLTDNGMVYTTRLAGGRGGRNAFEHQLHALGITQKNGAPNHPQTQGKIERFHQTLKRWLIGQARAHTIEDLNEQLDKFRQIYNHERPHRALDRRTPAGAYSSTPKAAPRRSQTRRPLATAHRPRGPVRQTHPPPRRPAPPHRHRPGPRRQTRPDAHPRHRRHYQRYRHRRDHPATHHRPHPGLPTQTKKNTPVLRPGCYR
ncbi:integrase core domain-containing protein [Arthrobacter sp. ISL-28]|uniref:integrase core domain-containing protein n=1 Tax=Arthrobacter sp. ISL-28 TaxID=2819108 RepID=UPI00288A75E6|nr:integrase core domain-containing protein [Arthrobacter sp. ISL-28]